MNHCFMIRRLINNLRIAKNFKGTSAEKRETFAILNRLHHGLSKKQPAPVTESFFGYKVQGFDYDTLAVLFSEIFVADVYHFETTNPQPLIIDCGANLGMSLIYFKKKYPAAHIHAFEANPVVFNLLKTNVEQNHLSHITLHNLALYDEEKEISFFMNDNTKTLVGSVLKERGGANEMKVQARKLSEYLKNIDKVDVIKIDVEGAEINIVDDLFNAGMLAKSDQYLIEYHHNLEQQQAHLSDFLKKFEHNGFGYNLKTDFLTAGSFQDILIHFYKKRD